MIFEVMLLQPRQRHQKSAYATVFKEWQIFFEKHIFHRLVLRQSDIKRFGQLFQCQRRALLQHLWLRIELPKYSHDMSLTYEIDAEEHNNNQIATKAVLRLLEILSSWERNDAELTLELSVHSPSDSKHYLPEYCLTGDIYPHLGTEDCTYKDFHAHMSRKRRRPRDDNWYNRWRQWHRIYFRFLEGDFGTATIPESQVVKKLLIRRQYICTFGERAMFEITKSLPGLESISLEAEPGMCPAKQPPLPLARYVLLPLLTYLIL